MRNNMPWSDHEIDTLNKLLVEKPHETQAYYADILTTEHGRPFTVNSVRSRLQRMRKANKKQPSGEIHNFKETIDINQDGSQSSNRLIHMSFEDSKDVDYLLEKHGYSKDSWELVSARSNIWNAYSKQDGVMQLYASKITVKPRTNSFNIDALIEIIKGMPPAIVIKENSVRTHPIDYFNIPLFDMHFGNNTFEYYEDTQVRIMSLLSNKYKDVLFIIGQDMFHNDNFRGTTSKGTVIDKVDMTSAWNDALQFYDPLINMAMSRSDHVHIMYSKGNHDETVSWCFVQMLKSRYPNASFDDRFKERKAYKLGRNFVGVCHGDKQGEKTLTENFAVEFASDFASATNREVYIGHKHAEWVHDRGGILLRRMPTGNAMDEYHDVNGYTKAHKRFQVLEYSETQTERIHYV